MPEVLFSFPILESILGIVSLFISFRIMGADMKLLHFAVIYIAGAVVGSLSFIFLGLYGIPIGLILILFLYSVFSGLSPVRTFLAVILGVIIEAIILAVLFFAIGMSVPVFQALL